MAARRNLVGSEVPLSPDDGLPRPCAANLDTLTPLARRRLDQLVAALRPARLADLDEALRYAVGLR